MIPYSGERHPTSGLTNVQLGTWLFVAIQVMLSASLISSHVLLSAGPQRRPDLLSGLVTATTWISSLLIIVSWAALPRTGDTGSYRTGARLTTSAACAALFVIWRVVDFYLARQAGALPWADVLIGSWYVLVSLHVVYLLGGAVVASWLAIDDARSSDGQPGRQRSRFGGLRIYWGFVVILWFAILVTLETSP